MKKNAILVVALLCLCALIGPAARAAAAESAKAKRPPNIIFFLADDLGYSEVGCYGQKKIKTPNIDRLAAEGMKFTDHYAGNAVCGPSRCVLMTGMNPGHAYIRGNKEALPEGQEPIPADSVTIAQVLQKAGYVSGAFGKWGLGPVKSPGDPLVHGFAHFFGFNCQRHAHNYYPLYLYNDDARYPLSGNPDLFHGGTWLIRAHVPKDADIHEPKNYAMFTGKTYAPDVIDAEAMKFIREHKDQPFFCYIPTTVPHLALQVPEDSLKEYEGKWPDPPYPGGKGYLPNRTPRAAYAAMVTRMDRDFGRMLQELKDLGIEDNTIVVFTSDNGPTYNRLGGSDSVFFDSADGFKGLKGSLYEGGIREPTIVRWPGHVPAGTTSDRVTGFEDWMPTLLDLVGAHHLIPSDIDGISFAKTLLGEKQPARPFLYREIPEYSGQQYVRVGNYVAIREHLNAKKPVIKTELYDLSTDRGEEHDIAAEHPDIVARMEKIMAREHTPSKLFPLRALDYKH